MIQCRWDEHWAWVAAERSEMGNYGPFSIVTLTHLRKHPGGTQSMNGQEGHRMSH